MLEDGRTFHGEAYGARGTVFGEVVFNTSMTGYQEVLTDPSYTGQIVTMTYPLIGNYGVNSEDEESDRPRVAGFVIHEAPPRYSNWKAKNRSRLPQRMASWIMGWISDRHPALRQGGMAGDAWQVT